MGSVWYIGAGKMKVAYSNGCFQILYERGSTPQKQRQFTKEVQRVDNVFYVQSTEPWRYTKDDAISMVEFLLNNMVYRGEQEKFKQMIRERLRL